MNMKRRQQQTSIREPEKKIKQEESAEDESMNDVEYSEDENDD